MERRSVPDKHRVYFHPALQSFLYSEEREHTPKQNWAVSCLAVYPREGPHIVSTLDTDGGSA